MNDIEKIRRVLISRKQTYLADLLIHSEGEISESNSFGHYLNSTLSAYYIYSPPKVTDLLNSLSKADKHRILDAVTSVYPPKENAPEIVNVEFQMNFENDYDEDNRVATDNLSELNLPIVKEQLQKCEQRITIGDYDGALTNARSLLETIFKHILNEANVKYKEGEKLTYYYKNVANVLKMEPGLYKGTEAFQEVLAGFISVVNGIASIRNKFSDSHGANPLEKYRIDKRHVVLVVNAARTIAEYLITVLEQKKAHDPNF